MSRLAQSVQKAVDDLKKAGKIHKGRKPVKEATVTDENEGYTPELEEDENQIAEPDDLPAKPVELTKEQVSAKTDTDLSKQGQPAGDNSAAGGDGNGNGKKSPVAKKAKKVKAPKAAKAPKAPKAPKAAGERKPRERKLASGKITKIEATGNTYITLTFEEGTITLTPTGHREQNQQIAAKALKALL